jgi:hypothetical protein
MKARVWGQLLVIAAAASVWACNTKNPARPTMSFVAPVAQEPSNGVAYNFSQQPIALQIVNSVRTGSSAVTYTVDVSTSDSFGTDVVNLDGIAEGGSGTTRVTLPPLNGNTTYFWRWRAVVDGIVGEPSATQSFFLRPNIEISVPDISTPTDGSTVYSTRPTFTVQKATVTGPAGAIFYEFQVSASAAFGSLVANATIQEQPGDTTSWAPTSDLPEGTLYWRVRAKDPAADVTGPFTSAIEFERRFGVDLKTVQYTNGPDISNWPETATLTAAYKIGDMVCTEYDSPNWPEAPFLGDPSVPVVGNQWVFVNVGGTWYGGAGHWLRPNQYCKSEYDDAFFVDAFHNPPLNTLVLHSGDVFGVLVSTPARTWPSGKTVDERTGVAMLVW